MSNNLKEKLNFDELFKSYNKKGPKILSGPVIVVILIAVLIIACLLYFYFFVMPELQHFR